MRIILICVLFISNIFTFYAHANNKIGYINENLFKTIKISQPQHIIKQPLSRQIVNEKTLLKALPLPTLALQELRHKAVNERGSDGLKALEFASPYRINANFMQLAQYSDTVVNGEAYRVYRLLADSNNALSINFGFKEFYLPSSASLFFYSADQQYMFGPVTSKDNDTHRQYWTPAIASNKVMIELNVAVKDIDKVRLVFDSINQGFLDIYKLNAELKSTVSAACNIDVVCQEGDSWRDQINAVAMYQLDGFRVCSGSILNNTGQVARVFLTAEHCNLTAQRAPSMVVIWNYQNSFCRDGVGGVGDGEVTYVNSGAKLLAEYIPTDMTIVRLDDPIPYNANVYLAGWNRASVAPLSAVAIHHPGLLEKRISFDNDPALISGYIGASGSTHIRVRAWDLGTTEPGSSGSPLFDQNKLVVGQLHGGFASCDLPNESDYYGRLAVSWNGGGVPSRRVKDWLDPLNTGAITLQGRAHNSIFHPDAFEPDNSVNTYTILQVNEGEQRHTLHNPQDIDWYGFLLDEQMLVEILTRGNVGDTYMELYDSNGTRIALNDDGGIGRFSRIQQTLQPGFYLIAVIGLNSLGETEAVEEYHISISSDIEEPCEFYTIALSELDQTVTLCL